MLRIILCVIFISVVAAAPAENTTVGIKEKDVLFYFYSRINPEGIHVTMDEASDVTHIGSVFNQSKPTVVLIHGWKDGYGAESNTYIREAILENEDANIIKVDWSKRAGLLYIIAKLSVPSVGKWSGKFLEKISNEFNYPLDQFTLVGFSLGAHVAGNIGKYFNGQLPLIIGLDPAGPLINPKNKKYSLNPADAQYVEVIHTNAGLTGMKAAIGHSDFYPNDGKIQPGCILKLGCSHGRAWEYYAESLKSNQFVSQKCSSYKKYKKHQCTGDYTLMGGFRVDTSASGVYYLTTNSKIPYGRGQE